MARQDVVVGLPDEAANTVTISELADLGRRDSARVMQVRFGSAVLVGPAELGGLFDEDEDDEPAWSYMTLQTAPVKAYAGGSRPHGPDSLVYGIVKRSLGPFAETVLVGRSSSNDICIDDPSISKLHARIKRLDDGTHQLTDAGSKNGTFHRDERLTAALILEDGAPLRFGDRRFTYRALDPLLSQLRHTR